jgi:hypothetical protein
LRLYWTASMTTFFSASLRSRCGPLDAVGAGVSAGALAAAVVLVPGAPGSCGPPAHPDSANPAANAATALNLLAGKGFPFLD